jgi:hypothetical protein
MPTDGLANEAVAGMVLARHGRTYAEEAGIGLTDEPVPLFRLLVLTQLLSARIGARVAVATAAELFTAGWTTPQALRNAERGSVVAALGRGGYHRYDERTATQLRDTASLVLTRYDGDLRALAAAAGEGTGRASALVQQVKGIGPTGAAVFLREVQAVWPWVRPYLDERARSGARRVGLPDDAGELAGLVGRDELARFAAGLVRVSLVPRSRDPLSD